MTMPASLDQFRNKVASTGEFIKHSSIEITPRHIDKLPEIAGRMPAGAQVYIALVDAAEGAAQIKAAEAVRACGMQPVPHVPARFIKNRADLDARLSAFSRTAGVTRALVLGGGAPEPVGDYHCALQLLETGLFEHHGINRLDFAGHPEGNADIVRSSGETALLDALLAKQDYSARHGIEAGLATQFLFEAGPVANWAEQIRAAGIDMPIGVGVPGPATIRTLVKYAAMCGVGNSARFIRKQAMQVTKLLKVSAPDAFLDDLASLHYSQPDLAIARPHFYPFGGFDKLFDWLDTKSKA